MPVREGLHAILEHEIQAMHERRVKKATEIARVVLKPTQDDKAKQLLEEAPHICTAEDTRPSSVIVAFLIEKGAIDAEAATLAGFDTDAPTTAEL